MRVIVATLSAAFLVAACQTPCPAPETAPVTVQFRCEDGSNLRVTFTRAPDFARVEEDGYTTLTLPARIAGAGYNYSGSGAELRRRGSETTWTRPGAAMTICTQSAVGATHAPADLPRQAVSMGPADRCPGADLAHLVPRMASSAS